MDLLTNSTSPECNLFPIINKVDKSDENNNRKANSIPKINLEKIHELALSEKYNDEAVKKLSGRLYTKRRIIENCLIDNGKRLIGISNYLMNQRALKCPKNPIQQSLDDEKPMEYKEYVKCVKREMPRIELYRYTTGDNLNLLSNIAKYEREKIKERYANIQATLFKEANNNQL